MISDVAVIVLTKNERLHIARCLNKIQALEPREVFVVDCLSVDGTQEIARAHGVVVVEHPWPGNQAKQFNWALDNLPIKAKWILRLDADEYLEKESVERLKGWLAAEQTAAAATFELKRKFMGREVRHGTVGIRMIRLFKFGRGRYPKRLMDERVIVDGSVVDLPVAFFDDNRNGLSWWTQKHVGYARREAQQALLAEHGNKAAYYRLPKFFRAFIYFCVRYFLRGGIWDGAEGVLWHFLQAFWYRVLVDAEILEIEKRAFCGRYYGSKMEKIEQAIKEMQGED